MMYRVDPLPTRLYANNLRIQEILRMKQTLFRLFVDLSCIRHRLAVTDTSEKYRPNHLYF